MALADVATGWTGCIPVVVREAEMVVHGLWLIGCMRLAHAAVPGDSTAPALGDRAGAG